MDYLKNKNILTIGAYERDNFGDLLFFLILKTVLRDRGYNIVAGSIVGSDMRNLIGEYVFPYHLLLKKYKWDVIWVVGGEMGALPLDGALRMSLGENFFKEYLQLDEDLRKIILDYLSCNIGDRLAYLPDINLYKKNLKTKLVLNSVGGFEELPFLENKNIIKNSIDSFKSLSSISVRNNYSHKYLESIGVSSRLSPDVVHILPKIYKNNKIDVCEYILFQVNKFYFDKNSIEDVGNVLIEIINKFNHDIYLFLAGTANLHDSKKDYLKIIDFVRDKIGKNKINIIEDRNPLHLVDWISNAKLWIGTSLHGRIISASYRVRRISLENKKVYNYCKKWDDIFPFNINLSDLLKSCEDANMVRDDAVCIKANELILKADDNLKSLLDKFVFYE